MARPWASRDHPHGVGDYTSAFTYHDVVTTLGKKRVWETVTRRSGFAVPPVLAFHRVTNSWIVQVRVVVTISLRIITTPTDSRRDGVHLHSIFLPCAERERAEDSVGDVTTCLSRVSVLPFTVSRTEPSPGKH